MKVAGNHSEQSHKLKKAYRALNAIVTNNNMGIFLSETELSELTDCQKRSKQMEWLDKYDWKYAVSRLGRVKVLRSYAEMRMGMPVKGEQEQTTEPDFSSLAT